MSDNWDSKDKNSSYSNNQSSGDYEGGESRSESGCSFGKGRGFNPKLRDRNNSSSNDFGNDERRGRGGGGDRGARGGGGRSNRNDDGDGSTRNNSSWGGKDDNSRNDGGSNSWNKGSNDNSGYENRGHGRGRDENRGGDENRQEDENGEVKERPPIYIPEELTDDQIFQDTGITTGINFNDYEDIKVNANGENVPPHINSFREAQLRDVLLKNIARCGYEKPTPIQKYSIPIIMSGRDLMATAQTGSGKTGAFLLPIINRLLSDGDSSSSDGSTCQPNALVFSPTRELAIQIYDNARKYAISSFLKVQILYGGTAVRHQANQLQRGCHILIATPGRLNDFVNRGYVSFGAIKFLVLDEADRMLDMGFKDDIGKVMDHPTMTDRNDRQTLMFSATFSNDIQKMAHSYLNDYVFVAVGIVGGACKDVEQNFIQVSRNEKRKELMNLLNAEDSVEGTLLFVAQKRNADFIASFLSEKGFKTTSIHGDRFQSQREEALRDFKSQRMAILVATNVAARGLDISGVRHVINYDLPDEIDEYVHRIGRTGRLGNKGKATSFYDEESNGKVTSDLVRILKQANQKVPSFLGDGAGGSYESDSFGATDYRQSNRGDFKTDVHNEPQPIKEEVSWD